MFFIMFCFSAAASVLRGNWLLQSESIFFRRNVTDAKGTFVSVEVKTSLKDLDISKINAFYNFWYSHMVQNSAKLFFKRCKVWTWLKNSKNFERKNRLQSKPEKGVCKNSVFLGKSTCLIQWNFPHFKTNFVIFEPTCFLEYTLKIFFSRAE